MISFGTGENENKYIYFFNAEFYRVIRAINALLTICSEMIPFSGNCLSRPRCSQWIVLVHGENENLYIFC